MKGSNCIEHFKPKEGRLYDIKETKCTETLNPTSTKLYVQKYLFPSPSPLGKPCKIQRSWAALGYFSLCKLTLLFILYKQACNYVTVTSDPLICQTWTTQWCPWQRDSDVYFVFIQTDPEKNLVSLKDTKATCVQTSPKQLYCSSEKLCDKCKCMFVSTAYLQCLFKHLS